jgi:thioredoxin reductase
MYDVIVIGGGPAGLQAALTLGRVHRSCLVLDSGRYRNDPAAEMHNFLTRDGTPPDEFRAAARGELVAYDTVAVRRATVTAVEADDDGVRVRTDDGAVHEARRLLLATGMADVLPEVRGVAELWGSVVAHCPFCHGHEFSGGTVAIQAGPHAPRLTGMLAPVAERVVVVSHLHDLTPEETNQITLLGGEVRQGRMLGVRPNGDGAVIELDDGSELRVDGMFVAGTLAQAAPFAEQLGLALLASGGVEVDDFGRTSHPRVYAAGDLAHRASLPMPVSSVLAAAAAGQLAATTTVADGIAEEMTGLAPARR